MADTNLGNLVWRITGDTRDFDSKINQSQSTISKIAGTAQRAGKTLSTFLTLPLLAAGGAAVKAASDLQESTNAVNVVFRDAAGVIQDFGDTASTSVGLSQTAFNELATVIGAQLKQSGQDIDSVAGNTIELTRRAADLASVFNTDVKDATFALGAALRGEAEPARRFGINISDAAVQAEALASGLVNSKDEIDDSIKVQARYNLILRQSVDVAGDFANTSDSLANRTRILRSDLTDVAAEFGEALIPIAEDAIAAVQGLVGWFGDLDDSSKQVVIVIGAVAAAIGPALIAIGSLTKAVITLNSTALLGPLGLVAALGAVVGGIALLASRAKANNLKELEEDFEGVIESANLAGEELDIFKEKIDLIEGALVRGSFGASFESANEQINALSQNLEISRDKVIEIGLASENVNDTYKEILRELKAQDETESEILASELERASVISGSLATTEKVVDAVTERKEQTEQAAAAEQLILERQEKQKELVEEQYLSARARVLDILDSEKTEYERITEQINTLQQTPWASGRLEQDRLAAIEILQGRLAELREEEVTGAIITTDQILGEYGDAYDNIAAARRELQIENERIAQEEAAAAAQAFQDLLDSVRDNINTWGGLFGDLFSSLSQLSSNAQEAELQRLEAQGASEEELAQKKKELARDEAERQRNLAIFQAIVNTAAAIVEALPNIPLSVITGIAGAAQIAAIASQPLPQLASGGILPPTAGGTNVNGQATAGEANTAEAVLPLTDEVFDRLGRAIAGAMSNGDMNLAVTVQGGGTSNFSMSIDELLRVSRTGRKVISARGIEGL